MRLYRKDLKATTDEANPVLRETTTIMWDSRKDYKKMWINSTFRQNNDYIKQWITVPLDLWDYSYADKETPLVLDLVKFEISCFHFYLLFVQERKTILYKYCVDYIYADE